VINSNLGHISHHFRDMAIFPLKNALFSTSSAIHTTPNLKIYHMHYIAEILNACLSLTHMTNYSCEKFSLWPKA